MSETLHSQPAPVFDTAHLAQYTGGDRVLEAELAGLLREQADRCLAAMATAEDPVAWKAAAHTLKGAARGVGAFALGEACQRAEEAGPVSWPAACADVRRACEDAFAAIEATLNA